MAASARKNSRKKPTKAELVNKAKMRAEVTAVILFAVGLFLFIAIFLSAAGKLGGFFSGFFFGLFGFLAYIIPFVFIFVAILLFLQRMPQNAVKPIILVSLMFLMINLIVAGFFLGGSDDPLAGLSFKEVFSVSAARDSGGIIGMYIGAGIVKLMGKAGLFIVSFVILVISFLLLLNTPLSPYLDNIQEKNKTRRERKAEERAAYWEYRDSMEPEPVNDSVDSQYDSTGSTRYIPKQPRTGRFWQRKDENLAKKQQKIIEHVQNDSEHIHEGQGPGVQVGLDGGYSSNVGYGLDPTSPSMPGTGLGDDYNEIYNSPVQAPVQPQTADINQPVNDSIVQNVLSPKAPIEPVETVETIEPEEKYTLEDLSRDTGSDMYSDEFESFLKDTYDTPVVPSAAPVEPVEVMPEPVSVLPTDTNPAPAPPVKAEPKKVDIHTGFNADEKMAKYKLPPIDLLSKGAKPVETNIRELEISKQKLEQALHSFGVQASVTNAIVGPSVTRYEVQPASGVKIQSIASLHKDLALKLEVAMVRITPIPGKSVIGIEAYNKKTTIVTLRDIIDSPEFRNEDSMLGFATGIDIYGNKVITNLVEMPHLLIAGTTGSGKSVCLNSILLSMLYRAKPNEVKLILIDPKKVELVAYNGISHLLLPVVTDPEKAAVALGYAVTLMEERYTKLSKFHVRTLQEYNNKIISENIEDEDVYPQIVIVIDELSDLMMTAPAKVQESITRLAAMGRASGIHLIVATQQPYANVLTGLIKSNIPSRIAFSVANSVSSRVILDETGAETLRGKGDMLFKSINMNEPMRLQGPWVSNSEIFKVTEYIKKQLDSEYSPDIMEFVNDKPSGQLVDEDDEYFKDAVSMVVSSKQASISMLQRRFRIGYNRAARLVDTMEEMGIVGASDGTNKARKVIMSDEQLAKFLSELNSDADPASYDAGLYSDDDNVPSDNETIIDEDDELPPFTMDDLDE